MNDYSTIEGCIRQSTDNPLNTKSGDVQLEFDFFSEPSFLYYMLSHAGAEDDELFIEYLKQYGENKDYELFTEYLKRYGKNKD